MKIAIAIKDRSNIAGHAGQASKWLLYDIDANSAGEPPPRPAVVELARTQVFHHFKDDGPHPLDGVGIMVAGSAGDGFIRHMNKRGTAVLLTSESDPSAVIAGILSGKSLPEAGFDVTTALCRLRDLFSRH